MRAQLRAGASAEEPPRVTVERVSPPYTLKVLTVASLLRGLGVCHIDLVKLDMEGLDCSGTAQLLALQRVGFGKLRYEENLLSPKKPCEALRADLGSRGWSAGTTAGPSTWIWSGSVRTPPRPSGR